MKTTELDKQLMASHATKAKSWGKIISHLKRHFDAWAITELAAHGYANFKMGYMPLLMNIGPDGITNKELAKKAQVTKQAMSKVVNELTDAGYIKISTHETDKRSVVIQLTTQGKKLVVSSRSRVDSLEKEYEGTLGKRKFTELKEMLSRLIDHHNEKEGGPI